MNCLAKQAVIGSVFALGLAVTPTLAQHGGHGGGHGAHHGDMPPSEANVLAKCPITGEAIDLSVSTETDDGPVYFCCKGCIGKYKANPAKYATQVAAQRKALAGREKVQVTCPVSGEPIDPKVFVEHDGRKVFFCCDGCLKKYRKNPDKYRAALADSYTYQTKCPVRGEAIDPTVFVTARNGLPVYFCCKGCDKKFTADPAKYVPNLLAQGITLDQADWKFEEAEGEEHEEAHEHAGHHHGHDD